MARKAKPWFYRQSGWWMAYVNGKKERLAFGRQNKPAAEAKLLQLRLVATTNVGVEEVDQTVASVIENYMALAVDVLATSTQEIRFPYLQSFAELHGRRKVADCRPSHMREWLKSHPEWVSDWTKNSAVRNVQVAFNGDNETEPSQSWMRFVAGCPDATIPDIDPLYALPQKLIKAIAKRLPGLWSTSELDLEYALSNYSGGGFISKQPFKRCRYRSYLLFREFAPPPEPEEPVDDESISCATPPPWAKNVPHTTRLETMTENFAAELDEKLGRTPAEINSARKMIVTTVQEDDELRTAFAGWLVVSSAYRKEVAELQSLAPPSCDLTGKLPILPYKSKRSEDFFFEESGAWRPTSSSIDQHFQSQFELICKRWCIQSLLTWDIPLPVECSPEFRSPHFAPHIEASLGLTLFVPWTVLKQKGLAFRKRIERLLSRKEGHLSAWISRGKGIGLDRFRCIFRLFVFYELGLKRRYGNRLRRLQNQLDAAFAEYFLLGDGVVRKYRHFLGRRLKAIERSLATVVQ